MELRLAHDQRSVFVGEKLSFVVHVDTDMMIESISVQFFGRVRFDANWLNVAALPKPVFDEAPKEAIGGLSSYIWSPFSLISRGSASQGTAEFQTKENERWIMHTKSLQVTDSVRSGEKATYHCSAVIPIVPASLRVRGVSVRYWLKATMTYRPDPTSSSIERSINLPFSVVTPLGAKLVKLCSFPVHPEKSIRTLFFRCKESVVRLPALELATTNMEIIDSKLATQQAAGVSKRSAATAMTGGYSVKMVRMKEMGKERASASSPGSPRGHTPPVLSPLPKKGTPLYMDDVDLGDSANVWDQESPPKHHAVALTEHDAMITRRAVQTLYNKLSLPVSLNIMKGENSIGVLGLTQEAYLMGAEVAGTIDFENATIPCYQVSVQLQTTEKLQSEFVQPHRKHSLIHHNTLASHEEYTYNTLVTHFVLAIPDGASAEFSSDIVSVEWCLRFEFIVGTSWAPPKKGELPARVIVWNLPIRVFFLTHPATYCDEGVKARLELV